MGGWGEVVYFNVFDLKKDSINELFFIRIEENINYMLPYKLEKKTIAH